MSAVGRPVLRLVIGALCVAAAAAIFAILSGGYSDGDLKVIGTSILFAIAASTGGAGAALRLRGGAADVALGSVVLAASVAAFALVTFGMWVEVDSGTFWRAMGALGIIAVDGAHACFVLARQRASDPPGARTATRAAVVAAAASGTLGLLAVAGGAQTGSWELLGVVLVVQLLATALAPLFRRLGGAQRAADPITGADATTIAVELRAIADALDAAHSPSAVRAEANRLRQLARRPELR